MDEARVKELEERIQTLENRLETLQKAHLSLAYKCGSLAQWAFYSSLDIKGMMISQIVGDNRDDLMKHGEKSRTSTEKTFEKIEEFEKEFEGQLRLFGYWDGDEDE